MGGNAMRQQWPDTTRQIRDRPSGTFDESGWAVKSAYVHTYVVYIKELKLFKVIPVLGHAKA